VEYERALAIAPTNWRAEYNRGNARLATGDVAGAIAGTNGRSLSSPSTRRR
jgi:hypothetical protein